jgi:hypothetical protein
VSTIEELQRRRRRSGFGLESLKYGRQKQLLAMLCDIVPAALYSLETSFVVLISVRGRVNPRA